MASKVYKYIFCFINAIIGVFTVKFHYTMLDIYGSNSEVYLDPFKLSDILIFILFFALWLLVFYILDRFLNKYKKSNEFKISNKKLLIISIITMLICWSPYYLTYFPGGVYSDTYQQFLEAKNGISASIYSVFYSLFIRLLYVISFKNSSVTFVLMTIIQILLFVGTISYFIVWLKNKKISKKYIVLTLIFFCINPRIPIYAISIWKDSLYSIFLFMLTLFLFDIVYSKGKMLLEKKNAIIYCLLCILSAMFRNDAYFIVFMLTAALLFKYFKLYKKAKFFYILSIITSIIIVCTYVVFIPMLKLDSPYREKIGIPLQQIAYVTANEEVSDDIIQEIDQFVPYDFIKVTYNPMDVDNIKTSKRFNNEYLENNKDKFWKLYFKLFIKYPKDYLIAFLFNNVGYWNYYLTCLDAGSDSLDDDYDVVYPKRNIEDITNNVNVIYNLFGFSLKKYIRPVASAINNCAIYTLFVFIGMYIMIKRKANDFFIVYLPTLLRLFILLLAAPVAFSSRYIIYIVLFMPLSLMIPFIQDNKKRSK